MNEADNLYQPPSANLNSGMAPATVPSEVPSAVIALLAQTRPWVRRLAVIAFVTTGLMVFGFVGVAVMALSTRDNLDFVFALLPSLLVFLLYLRPAIYLWQFSTHIQELEVGGGQRALEAALNSQRGFWKFIGVLTLVLIGLYVVAMVVLLLGGLFGFFKP